MKQRKLGNSGIEIAPLMLGGNVFGWTIDEPTSFRILDAFVDAGFNAIDTADGYSFWKPGNKGGESETIIGNWLTRTGKRNDVIIATKVGYPINETIRLSRSHIMKAVEDSLKRLQVDCIDLYQSHKDDPKTSQEETLEAYAQLIKQGKIRAIGASNYNAARLSEALQISEQHGIPRYETLQPLYNLYDREDFETELAPLCEKMNVGVISHTSLARGFLTGKYRSEADLAKSPRGAQAQKCLNERGFRILDALDAIAKELNTTPGNIAIAWLLTRPSITAPIASATSMDQLNDLIAATRLHLENTQIELLNQASSQ